ncbi:hypothetical protein C8U37_103176 [Trichococcus patagoniensis]|uniref:Uncharacterized protein n=1 Tax=Trichococcus patagoniensis TaxID=382641 RepID=A0A2T5IPP1_9LACT|nr:hypothetical protein C8U37_103176 [Trichococcus patagoniensis]
MEPEEKNECEATNQAPRRINLRGAWFCMRIALAEHIYARMRLCDQVCPITMKNRKTVDQGRPLLSDNYEESDNQQPEAPELVR